MHNCALISSKHESAITITEVQQQVYINETNHVSPQFLYFLKVEVVIVLSYFDKNHMSNVLQNKIH